MIPVVKLVFAMTMILVLVHPPASHMTTNNHLEKPFCTGSGKNIVCTDTPSANNNGHTVVGLPLDDYMVTIEQMDNGLRTLVGEQILYQRIKG